MRVLLPPSETKTSGGGNFLFKPTNLSFNKELLKTRTEVAQELQRLSKNPEEAQKALKVGARAAKTITNNLNLYEQTTLPAVERYTGVLFAGIDYNSMNETAKKWVHKNVFIQSALLGLISAADEIPNYRLSATSTIKGLSASLKNLWRQAHSQIDLTDDLLIDMRSKAYADLAPMNNAYTIDVYTKTSGGEVKALNHFNKTAKGDLVAKLAKSNAKISNINEFLAWAKTQNLHITQKDDAQKNKTLEFFTFLGAPKRS